MDKTRVAFSKGFPPGKFVHSHEAGYFVEKDVMSWLLPLFATQVKYTSYLKETCEYIYSDFLKDH